MQIVHNPPTGVAMSPEMFEQLFTLSLKVSLNDFTKGTPPPVSLFYNQKFLLTDEQELPVQQEMEWREVSPPPPNNFQSFRWWNCFTV